MNWANLAFLYSYFNFFQTRKKKTKIANERQERAFYLSLAAILGDGIYNFGELLMHPILNSLTGTRDQWLVDLLFSFNRGDLDKFEALKTLWTQQADLKAAEVKMRQKICLLCLMEVRSHTFLWTFEHIKMCNV